MSSSTVIVVTDDLTGEEGAQTVRFSLGTAFYEVDLTDDNFMQLEVLLAPYIAVARRASGVSGVTRGKYTRVTSGRNDPAYLGRVKAWAKQNAMYVPARGRVPKAVLNAYEDAGGK